ncbi:hypothetical protein STEG23_028779 [Scotinomys teguina]
MAMKAGQWEKEEESRAMLQEGEPRGRQDVGVTRAMVASTRPTQDQANQHSNMDSELVPKTPQTAEE